MNNFLNSKILLNSNLSESKKQEVIYNFLNDTTRCEEGVIETVLRFQLLHKVVWISQETIAALIGCSLRQVIRITNHLNDLGFLIKKRRGTFQTCLYRFNPELFRPNLKAILMKFFPMLSWIPLTLLKSLQSMQIFKNVTLKKIVLFNIHGSSVIHSNFEDKGGGNHWGINKKIGENQKMGRDIYSEAEKLFKLTNHGKAKLMALDQKAITYALDIIIAKQRARQYLYNPFKFFFNKAVNYSQEHKLKLDWKKYYDFKDKLDIPDDAPETEIKKHEQISTQSQEKKLFEQSIIQKNGFIEKKELPIMYTKSERPKTHSELIITPIKVESPGEIIQNWEKYVNSPKCYDTNFVFVGVVDILYKKEIEESEIDRLLKTYPILQEKLDKYVKYEQELAIQKKRLESFKSAFSNS